METTQQNGNITDWISEEEKAIGESNKSEYEELPSLKIEENKVTQLAIDFSVKPNTYTTQDDRGKLIVKAIIPVIYKGQKYNWWLNKANPVYRKLLEKGKENPIFNVSIVRTGQQMNTRYAIVD